jgi:hypothetical protein
MRTKINSKLFSWPVIVTWLAAMSIVLYISYTMRGAGVTSALDRAAVAVLMYPLSLILAPLFAVMGERWKMFAIVLFGYPFAALVITMIANLFDIHSDWIFDLMFYVGLTMVAVLLALRVQRRFLHAPVVKENDDKKYSPKNRSCKIFSLNQSQSV